MQEYREIIEKLDGLGQRMDKLDQRMDGFDQRMDRFDQRMDGLDQRMDGFNQRMDEFDQRMYEQDQRIDRLGQRMDALSVIIENTVCGQLKILAEGHTTILETLAPKSKTEELEEEVDFLKSIVRAQAVRIDALEKKLA